MHFQCITIGHFKLSHGQHDDPLNRDLCTYAIGCVSSADLLSIEQKSYGLGVFALPLAKGIHEFLELGASLDLEEYFVVVVRHLDIEVLTRGCVTTRWRTVGLIRIRHFVPRSWGLLQRVEVGRDVARTVVGRARLCTCLFYFALDHTKIADQWVLLCDKIVVDGSVNEEVGPG